MKKPLIPTIRKRKATSKKGMPPGKIVYIGQERQSPVRISVMDYDQTHFEENVYYNAEDCFKYKNTLTNTWINVDGVYQTDIVEKIGTHFGISTLVLEDVVNTNSRPKIDDFKDYVFIILKMMNYDKEKSFLNTEQVSLILGNNFVISFQENEQDLFDGIRARLRESSSRIRNYGSDYLTYNLMDRIVDEYFLVIETMGEKLEVMEDEVATNPTKTFLRQYNKLKQDSVYLRKSVWPLREVINFILRNDASNVKPEVLPYFRDLYDHSIQVIDTIETYRDLFSDLMDVYLSTLSLKMNEVMKVLTIISTIFIPLTFIVGIYGMNFDNMPELRTRNGYFVVMGFILVVATGMIIYFKRKKWF